MQDAVYKEVLQTLQQQLINALNEKGVDTGQPSQPVETPEKVKAENTIKLQRSKSYNG